MTNENLRSYTLVPEPNESYFVQTKSLYNTVPLGNGSVGFLLMLSTLQYQAPYLPSQYSGAASQAGKAAYIQSGAQASQDKLVSRMGKSVIDEMHQAGVTDTEAAIVLGTIKTVRNKQVDLNGPRLSFFQTHLTLAPDHTLLGFKMDF